MCSCHYERKQIFLPDKESQRRYFFLYFGFDIKGIVNYIIHYMYSIYIVQVPDVTTCIGFYFFFDYMNCGFNFALRVF